MIKTISKNGVMLTIFALVTTALISLTFVGTKDKIAQQQRQRLLSVLNEVVPADYYNNTLHQDCTVVDAPVLGRNQPHRVYRARMNDKPVALAIQTTAPDGYSGNIRLVVGVTTELTVLGVRAVEHKETPGLGDKIELAISDWILSFTGKTFNANEQSAWQVEKDGGEFDQFTGATITPRAVVDQVRRTLLYVKDHQQALFTRAADCYQDSAA